MKLALWRKQKGKTQEWLASELGCSQPYVSQIERSKNPIIPGPDIMERVFVVTDGAVEPSDFYDVPAGAVRCRR